MMKENMSEIELTHEDVNQLYNIVEFYIDNINPGMDPEPECPLSLLEKLEKHI
tara:strand:+ start:201 stop:359 length:159 start_codon:yes stop_codon:yes gene_type:complete